MRTARSLVESHTAKLFGPTYRRDLSQHVSCTDVVWDFDCLTHKVRQHNSYTLAKPYDMQHRPVAETFLCKAWKMNSWSPKITEATRSTKTSGYAQVQTGSLSPLQECCYRAICMARFDPCGHTSQQQLARPCAGNCTCSRPGPLCQPCWDQT